MLQRSRRSVPRARLFLMTLVPLVLLGAEGRVTTDPPRPRSRIDVYCFEPITISVPGDPLRAATRAAVEEQVRQAMADVEHVAALRSGRA